MPPRGEWKAEPVDTTELSCPPKFCLYLHREKGEFYATVEPEAYDIFMRPTDIIVESWIIDFLMDDPESDFFDGIGPEFSTHFPAKSFKDLKDKLIEMKDRGIVKEYKKKWSLKGTV